ncbi:MAG TPA: phenylacetyl-CoA:acceptor oxidoreductase [Casimicrobiaceae bacterium]|nr:phenylacetyl-CoA:acceptor oxidoreductase [Casimicrobiaceae bacterium]
MTYPAQGYGTYGPDPWRQTSWDVRAAGNFIFGGMGGGLIVFTVLAGASGGARAALLLAGLALVGAGLFCVSLELGRPLRALNVFRNPRTSWMAREAWTSALLVPAALATAAGVPGASWLALALALLFVGCQARLLQAAKGIPAWRAPAVVPFLVFTGLAEGAGVFFVAAPWHGAATLPLLVAFGVLLLIRIAAWLVYRRRVAGTIAAGARAALDAAGRVLQLAGTALPLLLAAAAGFVANDAVFALAGIAGLLAALSGAYAKLVLVTRAGWNQGFALPHLPVRGART